MKAFSDVIVVGSGASAVHAAYRVVEARLSVTMLDVGHRDSVYGELIPRQPFEEIRRTDPEQHRYFLGDQFEGVPLNALGADPQITPPRKYVVRDTQRLTPIISNSFQALQSLARGGLAAAWGAVSFPFLDTELVKAGLAPGELRPHYEVIAKRIGLSGSRDDLESMRGDTPFLLPPLEIDHNAEAILSRYSRQREKFHRAGLYIGRPVMAVLSQAFDGRGANPYRDMDLWSNKEGSVYSPDSTLRKLEPHGNFSYRHPYLVEAFAEQGDCVRVCARSLETGREECFGARRLILAAGALGTARIVLRSLKQYDVPVPITCNGHVYVPCLHYRNLGKPPKKHRYSLAQLTVIYDPTQDQEHLVQAQLYSCGSLLVSKLLRQSRLPYRESLRVLCELQSSLVILLVEFEDYQTAGNTCTLRHDRRDGHDYLQIKFEPSSESMRQVQQGLKVLKRFMRKVGCWPIQAVAPIHGSSIHYASPLAMTSEEKPLTTEPSGRLRGTRWVYVADGAALAYLPAKGPTLTLMANADRVGVNVLNGLVESACISTCEPRAGAALGEKGLPTESA
jgi:choline dehydrogenase-like flavoprotein